MEISCPRCPLGELERQRWHLHCAICGYYELIPRGEDD